MTELPKELQEQFKDIFAHTSMSCANVAVQTSWEEACDDMENTSMFGSDKDE